MILRREFVGLTVGAAASVILGAPALAQETSVEEMLADRVLGDPDAPVTMIEYSSLTCPHCAAFHREKLPTIKEEYIDTGKVKFIIRDYPLDQRAAVASMLTRCAPEPVYHKLMDVLFERQAQWAQSQDVLGALAQIGRFAQMSEASITACFQNQELYTGIVNAREDHDKEVDIRSTPTFTVNGEKLVGNDTIERFKEVIESNL